MAELTIQQTFDLALRHHQTGRLAEAEQLYRQVLAQQPEHPDALHLLGVLAGQMGQVDLAVELIRRAIAIDPHSPEAHSNLGNVLKDQGQLDEAIAACRQAIVLRPNYADAYNNLGNALRDKGQLDEAMATYRQAIIFRPDYAEASNNLGNALRDKGQLNEAMAAYRQAIALRPDYAEAHNNLGGVLTDKGQLDKAIAAYRQAITFNPNLSEAHYNLGIALKDKGQLDEAVAAYRQALQLKPNYAEAHSNLGNVYKDQGRDDLAKKHYRLAIQIKPDLAMAYENLGLILEQMGDFQEAERCYRQSIQHVENNAVSYAKLASLLGHRLPDRDLITLQALLAEPSSNVAGQSELHFAAARVLDGREGYREAAEHLRVANALRKAQVEMKGQGYDPAAHAQFVSRMIETCSAEFFQHVHGMGLPTQRPVFIIGLPRSGTTLVEQILAGHSEVFGAGELPLGKADFLSLAGESAQTPHASAKTDMAFKTLGRLDRETIQRVARRHLLELNKLNSTAARIVDKMPDNYLYLGLLTTLFPQARFIHCRRDLRDVAVSCWITRFESLSWTNDLEHITIYFEQYRRLMAHWRTVLEGRWLDCDYEQTVADLPEMVRRLVAWCGLEWEPACLDFHLVKRPVRTASLTQVREPISNRSIGRWKHYQELLSPVLDRLS